MEENPTVPMGTYTYFLDHLGKSGSFFIFFNLDVEVLLQQGLVVVAGAAEVHRLCLGHILSLNARQMLEEQR